MTETQKRIKAYKEALPGLRERVVAVALLLAMSVAMMTSASFAWLTISRSPEVTGVNTNIAANGNLEIALANGTTPPGESKVGDSSAAEGQNVPKANITWGNLVNLSDPSYGLERMTLRPAWLNESSLLVSPLYGAVYQGDGRVSQLNSNFAYTTWDTDTEKFLVTDSMDKLGVRAISSTKLDVVEGQEEAKIKYEMRGVAESANLDAGVAYLAITNNKAYMNSLANIMGVFMTARMNSGQGDETLTNPSMNQADVQNLRNIFADFVDAYDLQFKAWAELANYKLFLIDGSSYNKKTAEHMKTATKTALNSEGILFQGWETAISDYAKLVDGLEKLEVLSAQGSVKWADSGLDKIVNSLMNIGTCTVEGTPINNIGASNASGYLGRTNEAKITNGVLFNFEQINGAKCDVRDLSISATVKRAGITVPASVSANISTTAATPFFFPTDLAEVDKSNTGGKLAQIANDTYGLAIDLWVRTNAESSYLTLEGNVMTEVEKDVPVMGTDSNGNQVNIYTLTRKATETAEDGTTSEISYTEEIYKKETTAEDGTVTVTWYDAETHTVFALEEGEEPRQKVEDVTTVVGYEGENRIWQNNQLLTADSTTQGSGSCYVYYADTPEDQARSLKLLESFNVAFVDDKGNLLAEAVMDTERHYAANGRVTVPLVLSTGNSINLGEDAQGNITYAITTLEKNVPTRITAIVYLDGTKLTNKEVLAAADIQGQLNIQFGSNDALTPIKNEELENKERRVSASVDVTNFDYDTATSPMTTNVTVYVDGDEPNTVTAFFLRAINASQGSREETMTFTKNAEGDWISSYTFTAPGKYVLRTVQLDGVDYDLETPSEVNVTGFAVASLSCTEATGSNHVKILTAADSSTVNLQLKFAADDSSKMPGTVQGRYIRDEDGSAVNVNFTLNSSGVWTGTATFLTSGNYTMQYLVLDGQYAELDSGLWQTADVTLGMRVEVYTTSPNTFKYIPTEMADNEELLGMQVKIMDNTGEEMLGLSGIKLTYGMKGSGIKTMDTDLEWDGSYYVGELTTTGPGIWQFSSVVVGSNTLTSATTSPTFTIMSPEPPEYYAHNTGTYQYKPNKDAAMNAQITNSAAATVQAYIIKDGASEGTWVTGTIGDDFSTADGKPVNNWSFVVPKDANGYQDGNWTMTALRLWDVFAEDGTPYTEEEPLVIDITDSNNVTKVVNRIYVSFATDLSQDFGKTGDEVTAQFMDSHTVSELNVDIKDFEGNAVSGVTDVQLIFTYKTGTSGTYGKYTSQKLNNATAGATITVALDNNNGTTYSQSDDATILYAGEYITTFSFKVSGTEYKYGDLDADGFKDTNETDLPANAPVFTVSSKAATVTVTGTNPAPGTTKRFYSVSEPDNIGQLLEGDFFKITNYTASVYLYTELQGGRYDQEAAHAKVPEVTLRLSNIPTGYSDAAMTFNTSNVQSVNSVFTFGSSTTATSTVGKIIDGEEGITGVKVFPKLYPTGKMTQNKLSFTYNGMPFEITLTNTITIDQPQSPTVLKYLGIPEGYTGTKPTQVAGNGSSVTVTLPKLEWTATVEEPIDGTWSAYTAVGEVTDENGAAVGRVYGYRYYRTGAGSTCDPYYYHRGCQYYIWTKFQSSCTAVTNIYTQKKQIAQWVINGKTYDAGTAVQISGEGIITATAVVSDAGEKVFVKEQEQTSYKYLYGYVQGESDSDSSLIAFSDSYSGTQIGATVGNSSGALPAAKVANASTANAANDTPGTNMTTDSAAYEQYWP